MKNKLDSNKDKLARLAISFLMAFFLWVYALSATGQTETKEFRDIPVKIINESTLTSQGLALDSQDFTVDVKLYGSTLQVSQIRKSELSAVIDVSRISSVGNHSVAVSVSGVAENVSVSEIDERYLSVSVSELCKDEKTIEVVKSGTVADGYAIVSEKNSSAVAAVYGNRQNVDKVSYIRGAIDINSTSSDITRRAILTAYDENGLAVEHVNIVPQYVDVSITVGKIKEVPVKVITSGEVMDGYVMSEMLLGKDTVFIAAKDEILEKTDYITTADIDLTGKSSSFSQTVALHGSEDVVILDNDPIKVDITIELKENKEIRFSTVRFLNVPEGYSCELSGFGGISAVFSGDRRILSQLDESDIAAFVDLAGYRAGEFELSVNFDTPEGVELNANQEIKVRVILKK